jgi:protein-disulfide isomerase
MTRLLTVWIAFAIAACAAPQQPRPDPALEARIAALESRLAALSAAPPAEAVGVAERLAALEDRVTALAARAPAPRPPRKVPDPAKVYAVPVGTSPVEGPATAKVTIVMGGEYACHFCHAVRATLAQLRATYGADLRIVYKSFIVHPRDATPPALAACAAHAQGKWKPMDDLLWARAFAERRFDEAFMVKLAKLAKLDMKRFAEDMRGEGCKKAIDAERAALVAVGVSGTPSFYINGRYLSGARPVAELAALIDEELAKANAAIAGGVAAADYYETIVKGGITALD